MKTYNITGCTNPYIAQRDGLFKGKTEIVIESALELADAEKELLELAMRKTDEWFENWSDAESRADSIDVFDCGHHLDGTRWFEFDSRKYRIEESED